MDAVLRERGARHGVGRVRRYGGDGLGDRLGDEELAGVQFLASGERTVRGEGDVRVHLDVQVHAPAAVPAGVPAGVDRADASDAVGAGQDAAAEEGAVVGFGVAVVAGEAGVPAERVAVPQLHQRPGWRRADGRGARVRAPSAVAPSAVAASAVTASLADTAPTVSAAAVAPVPSGTVRRRTRGSVLSVMNTAP
ncbi:hypothetical protein GCM10010259_38300 [Streptomyces daghestanicus]|uniref:Uncharacterized protein n=1 Tax=Streptomyces daghestanicus TaxID=66885 RepID=A0ABQ3QAV4_9ACTN|nr:hypothetical protein GCM10010259_38300 [Streptomyces daghestanicus]GHI34421.1 hypothetical protein Sdagh_61510 [Streptomyces daghestanicus]